MPNLSSLIKSIRDIMREDRGLSGDGQRIEQLAWMLFLKIMDDKDQEQEILHDDYVSPVPSEFQWRNWAADAEGITGDELQQFIDQRLFPALRDLPAHDPRSFMVREVFEGNNNYMKSGTNLRKVVNKLNGIDFNPDSYRDCRAAPVRGDLRGHPQGNAKRWGLRGVLHAEGHHAVHDGHDGAPPFCHTLICSPSGAAMYFTLAPRWG